MELPRVTSAGGNGRAHPVSGGTGKLPADLKRVGSTTADFPRLVEPDTGTFQLAYKTTPFAHRELEQIPEGTSISELVERKVSDSEMHTHVHVEVGGMPVSREYWSRVRVKAGQTVTMVSVPGDNNTLRIALFAAIVIAAAAGGPAAAGALGLGPVGFAAVAGATSFSGSIDYNRRAAP